MNKKIALTVLAFCAVAVLTMGMSEEGYAVWLDRQAIAQIVVVSGDYTYIAEAKSGTLHTADDWRVRRVYVSGGTTVVTWADGNSLLDNTPGTNGAGLAALTYR